ncbi:MAG: hypothetical protein HF307_12695 [Ignavibacteria bacterium]|jgi:hypothetical protein|nr:hypothetical protein [Ignavibacteria bacterium]
MLLIVFGIIIVGLAVIMGISLFHSNSMDAKRNNVINESVNLSSMAQRYYVRPVETGGGGKSFIGWQIPPELLFTENGHYSATVSSSQVVILGTGNEVVTGADSVRIKTTVYPKDYKIEPLN